MTKPKAEVSVEIHTLFLLKLGPMLKAHTPRLAKIESIVITPYTQTKNGKPCDYQAVITGQSDKGAQVKIKLIHLEECTWTYA
jgi:hypothetical protein